MKYIGKKPNSKRSLYNKIIALALRDILTPDEIGSIIKISRTNVNLIFRKYDAEKDLINSTAEFKRDIDEVSTSGLPSTALIKQVNDIIERYKI